MHLLSNWGERKDNMIFNNNLVPAPTSVLYHLPQPWTHLQHPTVFLFSSTHQCHNSHFKYILSVTQHRNNNISKTQLTQQKITHARRSEPKCSSILLHISLQLLWKIIKLKFISSNYETWQLLWRRLRKWLSLWTRTTTARSTTQSFGLDLQINWI